MAIKTTINPKAIDLGNFEIIKNINTSIDNINNDMYDEEGDGRKLKLVTDESLSVKLSDKLSDVDLININSGLKKELDIIKASQGDSTALDSLSATVNGLQSNFNGLQSNLEQCSIIATNADNTAKSALSKANDNSSRLDGLKLVDLSDYEAVFEPYVTRNEVRDTVIESVGISDLDKDNIIGGIQDAVASAQQTASTAQTAATDAWNKADEVNNALQTYKEYNNGQITILEGSLNERVNELNDRITDASDRAEDLLKKAKVQEVIVGKALSCPGMEVDGNGNLKHKGSQTGSIYFTSSDVIKFVDKENERVISCKVFLAGKEIDDYWKNCGRWLTASGNTQWVNNQNADKWVVDNNVIKELRCYVVLNDVDITKFNGLLINIKESMPTFSIKHIATWVYDQIEKGNIKPCAPGFSCKTTSPFLKVINNKVVCDKPMDLKDSFNVFTDYNPLPLNLVKNYDGADLTFFYMLDPFGQTHWPTNWPADWQINNLTATNTLPLKKSNIYNQLGTSLNNILNFYRKSSNNTIYKNYKVYRRKIKNNVKEIKNDITGKVIDGELSIIINDTIKKSNIKEHWTPIRQNRTGINTSPQIKIHKIHRRRYISKVYNIYNSGYKISYEPNYFNKFMETVRGFKINDKSATIVDLKSNDNTAIEVFKDNPVIVGPTMKRYGPHMYEMRLTISSKG